MTGCRATATGAATPSLSASIVEPNQREIFVGRHRLAACGSRGRGEQGIVKAGFLLRRVGEDSEKTGKEQTQTHRPSAPNREADNAGGDAEHGDDGLLISPIPRRDQHAEARVDSSVEAHDRADEGAPQPRHQHVLLRWARRHWIKISHTQRAGLVQREVAKKYLYKNLESWIGIDLVVTIVLKMRC